VLTQSPSNAPTSPNIFVFTQTTLFFSNAPASRQFSRLFPCLTKGRAGKDARRVLLNGAGSRQADEDDNVDGENDKGSGGV
jgi:hypothetical protein